MFVCPSRILPELKKEGDFRHIVSYLQTDFFYFFIVVVLINPHLRIFSLLILRVEGREGREELLCKKDTGTQSNHGALLMHIFTNLPPLCWNVFVYSVLQKLY